MVFLFLRGDVVRKNLAWRFFLIILCAISICFTAASFQISRQYQVPFNFTSKLLIRSTILSGVSLFVQFDDPSSEVKATLEPESFNQIKTDADYMRVDDYFSLIGIRDIQLREINNERIVRSSFSFGYQTSEEEKLKQLRAEYNLDSVISQSSSEFESMVLLRNWTRSQFRRKDFQPHLNNFNALELLRKAQRNFNDVPYQSKQLRPCHFFPLFYSQILSSMGYISRLVRISYDGYYSGHGMVEVWSNQFKKWITMDADLNLHYERNGVPLNVLEVHNARYQSDYSDINIVRTVQNSGDNEWRSEIEIEDMIQYHSYFHVPDMRNDWMTNHYFRGHPKRSDLSSLTWVDNRMKGKLNLKRKTDKVEDFYWTLNQTEVLMEADVGQQSKLQLIFKTFTPNFDFFEIELDGVKKIHSIEDNFTWDIHKGSNQLLVRSINKLGVAGIPSSIALRVD